MEQQLELFQRDLAPAGSIGHLQAAMSRLPQVRDMVTEHYFADGMYCRVVARSAGTLIVGKVHKREHFYMVVQGAVALIQDGAEQRIYEAPSVVVSKPGTQRAVLALEDSVCLTVHRTNNTDLEEIERELLEDDPGALFDSHNRLKELPYELG